MPSSPQETEQIPFIYSTAEIEALHRLFNQNWLTRWQEIKDSVVIDDLEAFANDLLELTAQYQLPSIESFAQNLQMQINQFALDQALEQLSHFPELIRASLQALEQVSG